MAGKLELDKPSTAAFVVDPSDEDVKIEDTSATGQTGAVLRGSDGQLAYPNYIPPGVAVNSPHLSEDVATDKRKTRSAPLPTGKPSSEAPRKSPRPSLEGARKNVTETNKPLGRSISAFPNLRRAGTNPPLLARALSHHQEQAWSSSSSEDDSDDDDTEDDDDAAPTKGTADPYHRFQVTNEHYRTKGRVSRRDGRLKISVNDTSQTDYLAKALGSTLR